MLDCLDPARHALFELPRFPRWVRPPVDGFDEGSTGTAEQSEDSRGFAHDSRFSRAVLLEWSGAVPTQRPGGKVAWQRTDFELVVSPDGATLFRKGELPPAVAERLRWERSSGY
jgi:hypothetical protein